MRPPAFGAARTAALFFTLASAACSAPSNTRQDAEPAAVAVYPPGISAFKNSTAAYNAGLYTSFAIRGCCFITRHAKLTLDKPAGARVATLRFFTPDVAPYKRGQSITVSAPGVSATVSTAAGKWVDVSLAIPPKYIARTAVPVEIAAAKSFNPAKLGLNNDARDLSVVLQKVEFR